MRNTTAAPAAVRSHLCLAELNILKHRTFPNYYAMIPGLDAMYHPPLYYDSYSYCMY